MRKTEKHFILISLFALILVKANARDYFQQQVNYTIRVELDDKKHLLKCEETVTYTNNSLDSLHDVYFHLWPNAYRNDETNLANQLSAMGSNRMAVAKESDFGYIDGVSFRTDGKPLDW